MMRKPFSRLAIGCSAALALAAGLAGCGGSSNSSAPTTAAGGGGSAVGGGSTTTLAPSSGASGALPAVTATGNGPYWLLEDFDVAPLLQAGLSQSMLTGFFNTPRTFLIIKPGKTQYDAMLPAATKVMSFSSYARMQAAINGGQIPSDVHWILYDNESWSATPSNEQHAPINYAQQAETLAHQHGYRMIFTPAADLAPLLSSTYTAANRFTGYLNLDIASQGAKVSDVFEIQAQQEEATSAFASFTSTAVSQAKAANPNALVLLGLTTAAPKSVITGQTMLDAYNATKGEVSGYWINLPGGTQSGPTHPDAAVQFLQMLAPSLGIS
jgi:hypothetical protein